MLKKYGLQKYNYFYKINKILTIILGNAVRLAEARKEQLKIKEL